MATKYPILFKSIQLIAVLAVVVGYMYPGLFINLEVLIAGVLILLVGIPHGATDHLIFRNLARPFLGTRRMIYFYIYYLLLIGVYAALWWFLPILSFAIFLLISAYHFGQSNWNYVQFASNFKANICYLLWGAYVIAAPVILHYDSSAPIIKDIVGADPVSIAPEMRYGIVGGLLAVNTLMTLALHWQEKINVKQLKDEIISLLVLSLVFFFTPVLMGFAIYFVFWHSLGSVMDQIKFFQSRKQVYGVVEYIKDTVPFTMLALVGLVGMYWLQYEYLGAFEVGLLFVFISIVTLPHMILIDQLYKDVTAGV